MDDVGPPEVFCDFDGDATELAVALRVVGIVATTLAVKATAIEVVRVVYKEILNAGEFAAVGNSREPKTAAHGNSDAGDGDAIRFGSAVAGQGDSDFMPERDQRFRQGFDDVRQTACLRKWQAFRCDEENLHWLVVVDGDELLFRDEFHAIEPAGGASS